ncbi:division plane positioning ATPase MipZ [Alteromonas flava]|uniref:nucleotide-binding protein n=1 Tax=Alteromonas flava TaxID=2048003 RepID=UPI000C293C99|nr:division plane positioning ATPase MipZ [Alteromonas flava]
MIMVIGGEKGGTGKSRIAQNMAVYFAVEQQKSVVLVDCETNKSTSSWCIDRNRNTNLVPIKCISLNGKIRNELLNLAHHYDVVIVDCSSHDNLALRSSIAVAQHVLLPLKPKRRDMHSISIMEDVVATCRMVNPKVNAAFVLTQCSTITSMSARINAAKEHCRGFEIQVLNSVTYSRNVYDDSAVEGGSVLESDTKGKAATEIRAIAEELVARAISKNDWRPRIDDLASA